MKTEISALELHYLMDELQGLVSAKLEQVYQIEKAELILQLHAPGIGKRIMRIVLGKLMYLASNKGEVPEKPSGFCLYLRKKLKNARLRQLTQLGFERIVEFLFETKEARFRLVVELFSKGNVVLCNEQGIILSALENQEWKDRSIRPKEPYKYPEKEFNFLTITKEGLAALLNKSDKENLVKTMAMDLGLGGVYAEELCLMAGVDKGLKSNQLSDKEVEAVFDAITRLRAKEISPVMYKDSEGKVKDIVPFGLNFYRPFQATAAADFNTALDTVLTTKTESRALEQTEKAAKTKIGKIDEMISQQRMRIEGLEKSEVENQRKGEFIYENYPLVQKAIDELNEMRKTRSWKDIRQKFKGHKIIKDVDEKNGEVTLEL
ncbi:MAG: NFACT family protein [Nanoarchaeota archaeon]|nr:NFACT family protein [Nanoarchaeota archaeon]